MVSARCLPLVVKWGEIADVERENCPLLCRGKRKLLLIRRGVFGGASSVVNRSKPRPRKSIAKRPINMAIEVKTHEERFKTGRIGHGLALP
jgi:hypothetical protein